MQASRMASEIWSAILSGWPSVTDSEVKRKCLRDKAVFLLSHCNWGSRQAGKVLKLANKRALRNHFSLNGMQMVAYSGNYCRRPASVNRIFFGCLSAPNVGKSLPLNEISTPPA